MILLLCIVSTKLFTLNLYKSVYNPSIVHAVFQSCRIKDVNSTPARSLRCRIIEVPLYSRTPRLHTKAIDPTKADVTKLPISRSSLCSPVTTTYSATATKPSISWSAVRYSRYRTDRPTHTQAIPFPIKGVVIHFTNCFNFGTTSRDYLNSAH